MELIKRARDKASAARVIEQLRERAAAWCDAGKEELAAEALTEVNRLRREWQVRL